MIVVLSMQTLVLKVCRLYNVFGSGASHSLHALFMKASARHNNGIRINLLRGAGNRMATFFYAMHRCLRVKSALLELVHSPEFGAAASGSGRAVAAANDIKNDSFWKAMYSLLVVVFPALYVLRLCDSNKPAMDRLFYLTNCVDIAIGSVKNERDDLDLDAINEVHDDNDDNLEAEGEQAYPSNDEADDDDEKKSTKVKNSKKKAVAATSNKGKGNAKATGKLKRAEDEEDDSSVGSESESEEEEEEEDDIIYTNNWNNDIAKLWKNRKPQLEHDYAVAAWFMSTDERVRRDCRERQTADHREIVTDVVRALTEDWTDNPHQRVDTFWREYEDFSRGVGIFSDIKVLLTLPTAKTVGKCHVWHMTNSLPKTSVFGHVAVHVCSKLLGIGCAERAWGDVKGIKSGKRSHLGGGTTEMQSIIYTSAKMSEARLRQVEMEKIDAEDDDAMFGDDDINFDLGLAKYGVDLIELQKPLRQFHAYVEEWELESRYINDPEHEAKLLQKYQRIHFVNQQTKELCKIYEHDMTYSRKNIIHNAACPYYGGWKFFVRPVNCEDEGFNVNVDAGGSDVITTIETVNKWIVETSCDQHGVALDIIEDAKE